ncbi:MAG TPA: hypothetical protein VMW81_05005 [Nitrospinota bacterium]|nr:hypothetical protein [Nitrospinota bacterium]
MMLKKYFRLYLKGIFILLITTLLAANSSYSKISDSYQIPEVYLSFLLSGKYKIAFNYLSNEEGFDKLTFKKYISIIEETFKLDSLYYKGKGYHFIKRSFENESFKIISHKSIDGTEVYQVSYNFEDTLQDINQKDLISVITWNITSTFFIDNLKIKHITQDKKRNVRLRKLQYI